MRLCSAVAAATMLAARQSKPLESGQQETYSVVTLINCRKFLEPVMEDRNVGEYESSVSPIVSSFNVAMLEVPVYHH